MMRLIIFAAVLSLAQAIPSVAQEILTIERTTVTEWKAVYGRIEARDRIPARTRLGGTMVQLDVIEGSTVAAGQVLARVVDEKLNFRLVALDAQLQALASQLDNAKIELTRGEELLQRGVTTAQRLDGLRTQVEVLTSQIAAVRADRRVVEQQVSEGTVLAPIAGRVLDVPVAAGAVVLPGEVVAMIGGGGFFLRLAVPERHAGFMQEGTAIVIEEKDATRNGHLAQIYPQIENGRVIADVEVPGLSDAFVGARVLVRLPMAEREAFLVPAATIITKSGLDFVQVISADTPVLRTVLLGQRHFVRGEEMVEIVTGLTAGDQVVGRNE